MYSTTAVLPVLSASIDWVTATTRPGQLDYMTQNICKRWFDNRAKEGYVGREWQWKGYVGQTIDGLSFGTRPDSSCVRLSGEMAARNGSTALRLAKNVSRLDVQVTLKDEDGEFNWHDYVRHTALSDARVQAGMTRVTYTTSSPDGRSCYIGSRKSDRYMRVYDKHAESEGVWPEGSWRWEIEYKAGRALRVAEYLTANKCSPETVRYIVARAFGDYGVRMPTEVLPRGWSDKGARAETTDLRRLEWLRTSVGPMIQRLLESTDEATILDCLGLGDADFRPGLNRAFIDEASGEISSTPPAVSYPLGWESIDPW